MSKLKIIAVLLCLLSAPAWAQNPTLQAQGCGTGNPGYFGAGTSNFSLGFGGVLCDSGGGGGQTAATSVAAGSLVLKQTKGTLTQVDFVTGASALYLMAFDSTTVPGDGTVSPKKCWGPYAATTTFTLGPMTVNFANGIVLVASTTGCFTKTISATAFISAEWQ